MVSLDVRDISSSSVLSADPITYHTSLLRTCSRRPHCWYAEHLATQNQAYVAPHPWRWQVGYFDLYPYLYLSSNYVFMYPGLTRT